MMEARVPIDPHNVPSKHDADAFSMEIQGVIPQVKHVREGMNQEINVSVMQFLG